MALQLYVGNSGSGKSYTLYNKIIDEARKNKKQNYIVLVPEQFTLKTQKKLVEMSSNGAILNIDVLSFQRLAFRIFSELGINNTPVIDEIGKTFIVRRVAKEHKDELVVFGGNLDKIGFVNEIKSLVSELLLYDISSEKLDEIISMNKNNKNLCRKLEDMKIVFEAFCDYKKEKYITSEEILDVLCKYISKSQFLKNATLVLDGFTGFTPIQKRLVEQLMAMSKDIYITITFDAAMNINSNYPEYHLFYMSSVMLGEIEKMAFNTNTTVLKEVVLSDNYRLKENRAMLYLEKNIFRIKKDICHDFQENIKMINCKNPLQEVLYAAGEISRLIRCENYRFKDIAIVTADMPTYGTYIKYIFDRYGIKCFVDSNIALLRHPAVEFLRSALRIVTENYSYNSVMRFVRNIFSGITTQEADLFDSYLVATGISRKKKFSEVFVSQTRLVNTDKLEQINKIRELLFERVQPFFDVISVKKTTVEDKTRALFELFERFSLQPSLEEMSRYFENEGQLYLAKEYGQIYKAILQVMDCVVEMLGEEKVTAKDYEKLLEAAFVEQTIGMIPPGNDEVVFGDIERSRFDGIKVLFVLGANDGIIPKESNQKSILSDLDRECLSNQGVELSVNAREQYFNQKYYMYLNLTKPSEKLYVCFSKVDSKGAVLNPSYIIEEIHGIFPNNEIIDMEDELKNISYIHSKRQAWDFVVDNINKTVSLDEKQKEVFYELYNYFEKNGEAAFLENLRKAGNLKRIEGSIDLAVAKALYGDMLYGSITRYEQFAKCAYSHFLKYGLMLKEREEAGFGNIDFGNIMHSVLEMYSKYIQENNLSWADDISDELIEKFIDIAITEYGNNAIYFTYRDKYQIERLKRMTKRTVWALRKQFAAGNFVPSQFEIKFTSMYDINNDSFSGNPYSMAMNGRIDRVDVYEQSDKVYVKVLDYKTGKEEFKLLNVYYGTSLQLMIYLNEAVKIASDNSKYKNKTIVPAAVLYYRINDDIIEPKEPMENYEDDILNALKVDGLLSDEENVLAGFDNNFAEKKSDYKSMVAPIASKKDGNLTSASKTISPEDLEIVRRYVTRKAKQIGKDILEGDVKVSPFVNSKDDACKHCQYKSICRFNENVYSVQNVVSMKESEIISAMQNELDMSGGGSNE